MRHFPLRARAIPMTFRYHKESDTLQVTIGKDPKAQFATFVNVNSSGCFFDEDIPTLLTQHTDRHIFALLFLTLLELHGTIDDAELYKGLYTHTADVPHTSETITKTIEIYDVTLREELSALVRRSKMEELKAYLSEWLSSDALQCG